MRFLNVVVLLCVGCGLGSSSCLAPPRAYRLRVLPSAVPTVSEGPLSLTRLPMIRARQPTHRVRRGETFYGIARQYRVPVKTLLSLNPSVQPRALEVGAQVFLPGGKAVLRSVREN